MIDLAELVDEPVPKSRKICCPFHDETTPSLHIYPDHFYCFGCHAYGDHTDWLMRTRGLSHDAAQEVLANWTGPVIAQDAAAGLALEEIEKAEKDRAYVLTLVEHRQTDPGHARGDLSRRDARRRSRRPAGQRRQFPALPPTLRVWSPASRIPVCWR